MKSKNMTLNQQISRKWQQRETTATNYVHWSPQKNLTLFRLTDILPPLWCAQRALSTA